jgi:hypothetical protein
MNQPPQPPHSFLGGPSYRPEPTPISPPGPMPYVPRGQANHAPILSVTAEHCTLTKPLLTAANLHGGQQVHLVVPRRREGDWYLDTNPKPGVGTVLPQFVRRSRALFRIPRIPAMHFQVSRASSPGFVPGSLVNSQVKLLHFRLGPEVEGHPGYYRLLRGL